MKLSLRIVRELKLYTKVLSDFLAESLFWSFSTLMLIKTVQLYLFQVLSAFMISYSKQLLLLDELSHSRLLSTFYMKAVNRSKKYHRHKWFNSGSWISNFLLELSQPLTLNDIDIGSTCFVSSPSK